MKTVGFIGAGSMGGAILEGALKRGGLAPSDITVFDAWPAALEKARAQGVRIAGSNAQVAAASDLTILAVKPKDALAVLAEIKEALEGRALLSIVAGLSSSAIRAALAGAGPSSARLLVTLPNTPLRAGEGATGFALETTFTREEKDFARRLFEASGIVEWVPEKLLPAVSALSGGGPAYAAMFVEALADGGVLEGLPRATAYRLAAQTLKGAGALLLETGEHPGAVKDAVCSPGGTTIEAVRELERGAFRYAVMSAVSRSAEKFSRLLPV
ncbi:MAG: pyrroline-5-carboxylate reductase [Treponema sp.]|jgi:pyrroline-5-carboxylate reductase|nr:pyrroline-5-carboxylate reductase [Treponema sp.]